MDKGHYSALSNVFSSISTICLALLHSVMFNIHALIHVNTIQTSINPLYLAIKSCLYLIK